jgi:hypothetical protein
MPNKKKQIPELRSEESEHEFWAEHDSSEFIMVAQMHEDVAQARELC